MSVDAARWAHERVADVRDDPPARLSLMSSLYEGDGGQKGPLLPYRRAAVAFMRWQIRRGLLLPEPAGSPWWRAVNERLLRDAAEARAALMGYGGEPSSASAELSIRFAERPSARTWYRAHNASVVAAYLDHDEQAAAENSVERFFINLVVVRVLYAHALVAAPRLALGWCAPIAPALGDPRVGMTGIFMSLSRVLPDTYPLHGKLCAYVDDEHGVGRLLDVGLIVPRLERLFEWSVGELGEPRLASLLHDGVPCYAWREEASVWRPTPNRLAGVVRRALPAPARPATP